MKKISTKRELFNEVYAGLTEVELSKEQLYKQQLINEKLEKIKNNVQFFAWIVIAQLIIGAIAGLVMIAQ